MGSGFIGQTSLPFDERLVLRNVPCDPSVSAGDWVRMDGTGTAVKAQADSFSNSNVIGLAEEKPSSSTVNILVLGISKPIFTLLDETKEYYLSASTAGAMAVAPVPTGSGEVVLKVGQPFSINRFVVLKGIRMVRS